MEALCAERHAVDTILVQQTWQLRTVTVSGFASTVTSSASGSAASRRSSAAGSVKVGVPPPRKIVSSVRRERVALQLELGDQRVDVARVVVAPADGGDEVAVAAAVRAERKVDVEVARAGHGRWYTHSLSAANGAISSGPPAAKPISRAASPSAAPTTTTSSCTIRRASATLSGRSSYSKRARTPRTRHAVAAGSRVGSGTRCQRLTL